jgi:hypothetical protein
LLAPSGFKVGLVPETTELHWLLGVLGVLGVEFLLHLILETGKIP